MASLKQALKHLKSVKGAEASFISNIRTYIHIKRITSCLPMASNYNLVPRPAVLLVDEGTVQVMERRETLADLVLRYQNFDSSLVNTYTSSDG